VGCASAAILFLFYTLWDAGKRNLFSHLVSTRGAQMLRSASAS
jgi:hypothetical protein